MSPVAASSSKNSATPFELAEASCLMRIASPLEAMTNLNDSVSLMSGNIDQLNFISAAQLLGKTVTGVDLDGELRTGLVEAVHLDGSLVVLTVDGEFMTMAGIIGIETTSDADTGTGDTGDGGTGDEPGPQIPTF